MFVVLRRLAYLLVLMRIHAKVIDVCW